MNEMQFRFACLSIEWLYTSYTVAYVMGVASIAVVLASLGIEVRRWRFSWLILYTPLLILQPGWRLLWGDIIYHGVRPASSDCGLGNRGESIFLTVTLAAILIVLIRGNLSRRTFLLRLTMGCWIFHALVFFLERSTIHDSFLSNLVSHDVADQVLGTVEGGAAGVGWYTLVLTLICAVLWLIERVRRRTQRNVKGAISAS